VEYEMYDYTLKLEPPERVKKKFKEKFGSHARKKSTYSLPKTNTLVTSHVIQKVLQLQM
jgi:hypothetical protein